MNEEQSMGLNNQDLARITAKTQKIRIKAKKSIRQRDLFDMRTSMRDSNFIKRQQSVIEESFRTYLYNVDRYLQAIDELCAREKLTFLIDLKNKLTAEEYRLFWNNLTLFKLYEGCKLQEEGKHHSNHYILIEGNVAAYKEKKVKEQEKQDVEYFSYEIGVILLSNTLENHKYNPYTVQAKSNALFLMFDDEFYQRFLKKIVTKEYDQVASTLSHTLLFRGIAAMELKKYIPYCSFQTFKYNQLVYQEGDLIKQIFLILDGEIEISFDRQGAKHERQKNINITSLCSTNIYKVSHHSVEKKQIKIVKVCKKELFGLEAHDVFKQNYYEHHVRVTSDALKVLCIRLDVLYDLQMEYPNLEQNLSSYLKKINKIHFNLLERCQNMTVVQPIKKKKRKRKNKKKPEISLEWWGLAQKLQGSKQYRLPSPPTLDSHKILKRKDPLIFENRTNKIDFFKRRFLQEQIKNLEKMQQKQNEQMVNPAGLIPRLQKVKIKMINTRPKVINNGEKIKKRLLEYAKNGEVFCDRLQLQ